MRVGATFQGERLPDDRCIRPAAASASAAAASRRKSAGAYGSIPDTVTLRAFASFCSMTANPPSDTPPSRPALLASAASRVRGPPMGLGPGFREDVDSPVIAVLKLAA
jgi:hypothetical protein